MKSAKIGSNQGVGGGGGGGEGSGSNMVECIKEMEMIVFLKI